ncbi:cytochrome b6-f complex subunit PetL [Candidatus Atelocyanobacterium thalassae]|uniref:Cytochrome b6-f complex subunit 6 n=2 Tax=Candidatus Atelocyanobacterium thalassae TaxID=713887 RepID=A0A086CH73_9CHRO|nr:cytochrome b6-f complex subunit PetL [Candidatus Atelocyanobacterium thalassa]KFF41537.1 MAG: hypothetical protein ucyna2_00606 [Candidatus Atelocyanobacterium thalassa isolate SIO64986]BDA39564.1 hypothetical protein CPARK_000040300 [cyanobacterium endosymbiont of Braarudosphaera bigelowii]
MSGPVILGFGGYIISYTMIALGLYFGLRAVKII